MSKKANLPLRPLAPRADASIQGYADAENDRLNAPAGVEHENDNVARGRPSEKLTSVSTAEWGHRTAYRRTR